MADMGSSSPLLASLLLVSVGRAIGFGSF